jgi:hypothetical protein
MAAELTVDETRTVFALWKAFSASAVASSIDYSEETATTLTAATSALLQPPLEQLSSLADERTDQIELNFQNGSSSSSRDLSLLARSGRAGHRSVIPVPVADQSALKDRTRGET